MGFPALIGLSLAAGAATPTAIALSKNNNNNKTNLYNPEIVGDGEQSEYVQTRASNTTPSTSYATPASLTYNPNASLWTLPQIVDANWSKGNILNPALQDQIKSVFTDTPQTQVTTPTSATANTVSSPTGNKNLPSLDQVVTEVLAGKYGSGADRKAAIEAIGMNYGDVQKAVNAKMRNSKKAAPIRQANPEIPGLNKNGNWMDILNNLLPYLTLGAGAYYLGRRN